VLPFTEALSKLNFDWKQFKRNSSPVPPRTNRE
jgi:hypothetical protein